MHPKPSQPNNPRLFLFLYQVLCGGDISLFCCVYSLHRIRSVSPFSVGLSRLRVQVQIPAERDVRAGISVSLEIGGKRERDGDSSSTTTFTVLSLWVQKYCNGGMPIYIASFNCTVWTITNKHNMRTSAVASYALKKTNDVLYLGNF
jgi:hypothetical protein